MRQIVGCLNCGHEQFVDLNLPLPDQKIGFDSPAVIANTEIMCDSCLLVYGVTVSIEVFE